VTGDHPCDISFKIKNGLVALVFGMNMRRLMIVKKHPNNNAGNLHISGTLASFPKNNI